MKIDGKTINVLLDTGAQINLVKRSFVANTKAVVYKGIVIKGVNGLSLTYGCLKIGFILGNVCFDDYFHIIDDVGLGNFNLYLGSKFFIEQGCVIDHDKFILSSKTFSSKIFLKDDYSQQSSIIKDISVAIATYGLPYQFKNEVSGKEPFDLPQAIEKFNLVHLKEDIAYGVASILNSYDDIFQDITQYDQPDLIFDSLQLTTDKYVQATIYRPSHFLNKIVDDEMKRLLDLKIISHSKSPFNSPVWVVPKKGGDDGEQQWRVVIDYRKLNKVTIQDNYPLPRIDDIIDQLGGAKYFSVMDLVSGFHQIGLKDEDKYKTAFSVRGSHYEFNRLLD